MKIQKMAELGVEELNAEEAKLSEQIFRFRFQLQTGNVENPSRLGLTRRDLARVKTLLRERELGIERHREADGRTGAEAKAEPVAAGAAAGAAVKEKPVKRPRRAKSEGA